MNKEQRFDVYLPFSGVVVKTIRRGFVIRIPFTDLVLGGIYCSFVVEISPEIFQKLKDSSFPERLMRKGNRIVVFNREAVKPNQKVDLQYGCQYFVTNGKVDIYTKKMITKVV